MTTRPPLTDDELWAIEARDTALRPDGEAWSCRQCDACGECSRLLACPRHDDDDDVLLLLAEVARLQVENAGLRADVESLERRHAAAMVSLTKAHEQYMAMVNHIKAALSA